MWMLPPTKEEQERAAKEHEQRALQAAEEHRKKAEAKAAWLRASTCPHCGQHPPIPPWFVGV